MMWKSPLWNQCRIGWGHGGTFYRALTADVHTSIFNLQPEHIQNKQNLTESSFLLQYKCMPLKASVSDRNNWSENSRKAQELKLQSCSYRFRQRSCVFFSAVHHNWDLSFLLHPRVILWVLCFSHQSLKGWFHLKLSCLIFTWLNIWHLPKLAFLISTGFSALHQNNAKNVTVLFLVFC